MSPVCRHAVSNTMTMKINPAVLRWVMDNEGWEVDELAAETGLDPERMRRWTTAESYVSLRDLKKMSSRFRRPMSVLLMAEAPTTTVPKYRRQGGDAMGTRLSRPVLEVIRKARFVQDNAAELLDAMNKDAKPNVRRATLDQSPESVAAENAAALGIEPPRRTGQGEERDRARYRMIRGKIESRNVFTMQEKIPEDGMAGFALVDTKPAIILVNGGDPLRRRIFTILHEYAHVLLDDGSVCPTSGSPADNAGGEIKIERWCDRFAGAVLMPMDRFKAELKNAHKKAGGDPLQAVTDLSDRFCVSRTAAMVRSVHAIDDASLRTKYSRCYGALSQKSEEKSKAENDKNKPVPVKQAVSCLAKKGHLYANLVAAASKSGAITTSTALDYLEIRLKNLDDLKMRCGGD